MNVLKNLAKTISISLLCFFLVLLSLVPAGCRSSHESLELLSGDFSVPALSSCGVTSPSRVELSFSKPVEARFVSLSRVESSGDICDMEVSFFTEDDGDGKKIIVESTENLEVGAKFVLAGEIADRRGNTLTFSIPVNGFNEHVPVLAFSELRNNWKNQDGRSEYVEFYVLTGGNLSGLVFENASKAGKKKYAFPPCEVKKGEYIVLHLQTPTENDVADSGAVDETGSNLGLSSVRADECLSTARDFWAPYCEKILAATDILVLRDMNSGGRIIDAVAYRTDDKESQWKSYCQSLAAEVEESMLWCNLEGEASCTFETAANITELKTAATKSLSRKGVELLDCEGFSSSARDWFVTGTKGFSPGRKN